MANMCLKCGKLRNYRNPKPLCRNCYLVNPPSGENHQSWKGGRSIKSDSGYVLIRQLTHPFSKSNGYIFEHRLVMEDYIGRYLQPSEQVHHKNGVKTDNRIENLVLTKNGIHCHLYHQKNRKCTLCPRKHLSRGFCKKHYWLNFLKAHRGY